MKKLLNPFVYYSGGTTLCVGILAMTVTVLIAGFTGQTFRGMLSYGLGDTACWRLAIHLFGGWIIFSLLLYAASRAFSQSKVRFIDIAGNQALAKAPALLLLVFNSFFAEQIMDEIESLIHVSATNLQEIPSAMLLFAGIVSIIDIIWFFAWSWKGFSIAANMHGRRAVGIYIVCFLFADALSGFVCRI